MEPVRGIKISDYCDKHALSTLDRLNRFIQASHPVQHAHQKGIIHRAIKPSGIRVMLQDGVPVLKVFEFPAAPGTHAAT